MALSRSWLGLALALSVSLGACGGGGSSGGSGAANAVTGIVQDLALDAEGLTTVVSFQSAPGSAVAPGNFVADGGQSPVAVDASGSDVAVTWSARVTPSHQVRVVGISNVPSGFNPVTTSDPNPPTFTIGTANQGLGLGNDTFAVQLSGAHVIESEAEDAGNWVLKVGGVAMDLTGTTLSLDTATQVLSVTTGVSANLHATFTLAANGVRSVADVPLAATPVAGTATGDAIAPSLTLDPTQNLAEDEYGRVLDFTFDEAMDPVFCAQLSLYTGASGELATDFSQPSPNVLRVTFSEPMVPGWNSVSLDGVMDCHGNLLPSATLPILAGSTVPNTFASSPVLATVANAGGDWLEATFTQALDPDTALRYDRWQLSSPVGSPVDLSTSSVSYDLIAKTLHIELDGDLLTGQAFEFGSAPGNQPLDVDGEQFPWTAAGTISGDATAPAVLACLQNRNVDPTGKTLDVSFDEDLDAATAENPANYAFTGGIVVTNAVLLAGLDVVRLTADALVMPGSATLTCGAVADLAGNAMAPQAGIAVTTNDTTPPALIAATASAVEGAGNDTLVVTFNDDMVPSEVTNASLWSFESPLGTSHALLANTLTFDSALRTATMVFDGGSTNLKRGDEFRVSCATMRDLGGNAVSSTPWTGGVLAETNTPLLESAWVETAAANVVHVRFSEPCDFLDDIAGLTRYTVRDSTGFAKGTPASAVAGAGGLEAELTFGFAVVAGSDTLDADGLTDLAGNVLFPRESVAIESELAAAPELVPAASVATTVAGEENDAITVQLSQRMSRWNLFAPGNWDVTQAGTSLNLPASAFSYDGLTTVTIALDALNAPSLATGLSYQASMVGAASAQGVVQASPSTDAATAAGDSTAPDIQAGKARLDASNPAQSVLIEMDEAIDPADGSDETLIDLNGGVNPDSAVMAGPRTVRALFSGGVIAGDTVNVSFRDLAGNLGVVSAVLAGQDVWGPLIVTVSGTTQPDAGGDSIRIVYNKPVDLLTALDRTRYSITNGAAPVALTSASFRYESNTHTVVIRLPASVDLITAQPLQVQAAGIKDHAGLTMSPPANISGAVTGDSTPPALAQAFVNWRTSALGDVLDLSTTEDVIQAANPANWTVSGGQAVMSVEQLDLHHYRFTLSAPLVAGDTISTSGLTDPAGNSSGLLVITPTL